MKEIPLNKLAETVSADVETVARMVKIELFSGIIKDTRVRTGRLRGNWQTTTGAPAEGEIERLDPNGNQATTEAARTAKGDTVDYIVNNLIYAPVWNERDAIIDRNVARIDRYVKEQIRKNS